MPKEAPSSSRCSLMFSTKMDDRGWTLLHIGARKGDLKLVERLLDEGMDVNVRAWTGSNSGGLTPLHLAAQGGHLQVMEELLERGANIDARTKGACGWTPLHNAAEKRCKAAIKFLIENGAFLPPDIEDYRFNPPLYHCPGLEWAYEEMKRFQQEKGKLQSDLTKKRKLQCDDDDEGSCYYSTNEGYCYYTPSKLSEGSPGFIYTARVLTNGNSPIWTLCLCTIFFILIFMSSTEDEICCYDGSILTSVGHMRSIRQFQ
ncbi:phytochrome-interacting ankyrin-repeat protein 2-like [Macadamia integrifolia]|uniref:phytochrome-interacting ankyrin-repeat protein 2-like n=1 Tax=Macadamia integrifolia TaxID=60698 RepID=UPI001C4FB62B|nr:phytochrome-interacting ankyrin-repeat protein 2-like [Macadamia integrifolia]